MTSENEGLTFGRYLKAKRQEAGFELEVVSSETKISINMLMAIEAEDHARLPEAVYVKGFLRSYARFVDVDEDDVVRSYLNSRGEFYDNCQSDEILTRGQPNFRFRTIMAIGLLLGVIVISVLAMSFYQDWFGPSNEKKNGISPESKIVNNTSTAGTNVESANKNKVQAQPNAKLGIETSPGKNEINTDSTENKELEKIGIFEKPMHTATSSEKSSSMQLSIEALEVTWLKIIVDEKTTREFTLKPGDYLNLEASEKFNLLIGNAVGVRLKLNGKSVPVPGGSGQVVNLVLP